MKAFNIFLSILFVSFAALQLNDPDPILWVLLYVYVAGICLMAAFGKYSQKLIGAGLLICVLWMLTLIPEVVDWVQKGMPSIAGSMKAESPHIEFTREFLGLLIAGAALYFQWRNDKKGK